MAGVPPAPYGVKIQNVKDTSLQVDADSRGNNGDSIDRWQLGYSRDWNSPGTFQDLNSFTGTGTVTGLQRGATYYFWNRVHNSYGWSSWSARVSQKMNDVPGKPARPKLSNITTTSVRVTMEDPPDNGVSIIDREIGFGLNGSVTTVKKYNGLWLDIDTLTPAKNYRFWARATNEYGAGPWSEYASMTSEYNTMVMYGGVWKPAVAYVRVNGVWKPATPMVKIAGMWKPTG